MSDHGFAATDDGDCGCEISLDEATGAARKLGAEHGKAAGTWVFDGNSNEESYHQIKKWIDDGDPLRGSIEPELAGAREVCDEISVDYDLTETTEVDIIHDAYADEARTAFWDEVERIIREHLKT
jgi:hypothetical protein